MKTWGYLVAIQSDIEPDTSFIDNAICFYMDDDNNYKTWGTALVDVTRMGEVETFPEETNNGSL